MPRLGSWDRKVWEDLDSVIDEDSVAISSPQLDQQTALLGEILEQLVYISELLEEIGT